MHTQYPQNWVPLGPHCRRMEGVADRLKQILPVCVTTSNLVVPRQRLYAEREGNPQNWERWGPAPCGGAWLTPINTPRPTYTHCRI